MGCNMLPVAVASIDDLLLCGEWCLFVGAALLGLLLFSSTRGRWWVLAVCSLLAVDSWGGTITLEVINVGTYQPPFIFTEGNYTYPNNVFYCGDPPGNNAIGRPFSRCKLSATGYSKSGVSYGSGSAIWLNFGHGWQKTWYLAGHGDFANFDRPTIYVRFGEGTSNRVEYTSDPRGPLPVYGVPPDWPYGGYGFDSGMDQHQMTEDEGQWRIDEDGNPVFFNNYVDPSWSPPVPPSGQHWEFGLRPGGAVMAPNEDIPEWYLANDKKFVGDDSIFPFIPTNYLDGEGVVGAGFERIDYWGRVNADGALRREELLRANKLSIDMTRSDMRSGFASLKTSIDGINIEVPVIDIEVPGVDGVTVDGTFDSSDMSIDVFEDLENIDSTSQSVVDGALSWESSLPGWCAGVGSWVFRPLFGDLPAIGSNPIGFSSAFDIPYVGTYEVKLDFAAWPWISSFRQVLLFFVLIAFTFAAAKCVQSAVL